MRKYELTEEDRRAYSQQKIAIKAYPDGSYETFPYEDRWKGLADAVPLTAERLPEIIDTLVNLGLFSKWPEGIP